MKNLTHLKRIMLTALMLTFGAGSLAISSAAMAARNGTTLAARNGTTLAAYKTLDICVVAPPTPASAGLWRYSGEIAVWNDGAIDTQSFLITDNIQSKAFGSSGQFVNTIPVTAFDPLLTVIPAGTTQLTALTTAYSVDAAPLVDSYIRNSAQLTITNHSGHIGVPFGPNPKFTYTGTLPPPACDEGNNDGCTYTQGYWGSKPNVIWPTPYSRDAVFFLATKNGSCTAYCGGNPNDDVYVQLPASWQNVLDTSVNVSQGYYQLAHQYIAAVLNQAKTDNPAVAPGGVQATLDLALAWLQGNAPSACTAASSCGLQKDWAAVLAEFNEGVYPGGPPHCAD